MNKIDGLSGIEEHLVLEELNDKVDKLEIAIQRQSELIGSMLDLMNKLIERTI